MKASLNITLYLSFKHFNKNTTFHIMKYLTTRNKLLQFEINAHVAQTHRYLNIFTLQINSISSLSISLTTIIFIFAKK